MKAYTTLTGISKLNDMVIEGQNQSATFRISIIPTYANRYNPFIVQSLNPDIASVRASGADTYTVTSVGLVLWIVIMNFIIYNLMEDKKYEYNNKRCKW